MGLPSLHQRQRKLVIRNLIGFQYMYKLKMGAGINRSGKRGVLKGAAAVLVNLFSIYPNFCSSISARVSG